MSGGIFVSYRKNHDGVRRPHALTIAAVVERLRHHFGEKKILVDMALKVGERYPTALRGWLRHCEVMIVIFHREWLDDLLARKDDEKDWVRWEVETALAEGLHVIPVLLDDARLPDRRALIDAGFSDLAEIGTRQYWRIGFAGWQRELAQLLRVLEDRVATEDPPQAQRPDPVSRKRFWPTLIVAAAVGMVLPWLAARLMVPDLELRRALLVALAVALIMLLVVPLGVVVVTYTARRRLDESDKHLAELAHDTRTNITVGAVVAGLAAIVLLGSKLLPWQAVLPVLAVVVGFVVLQGDRWLRDRRGDLWPYPHLAPHPASVRGALAHSDRFMAERDLLTRVERDQVEFVLGQTEWAVRRLHDLCRLSRWAWLRQSVTLLPALHLLTLAAVLGSAAFAVVEGVRWDHGPLLVGTVIVALFCYVTTFELAYRLQRWRRKVVADAAPAEVDRLRTRLAEISIPPAAPQENAE